MLRKIGKKIKKFLAVLSIIVLTPYIITVFANGGSVETSSEVSEFDKLLKEHCVDLIILNPIFIVFIIHIPSIY